MYVEYCNIIHVLNSLQLARCQFSDFRKINKFEFKKKETKFSRKICNKFISVKKLLKIEHGAKIEDFV